MEAVAAGQDLDKTTPDQYRSAEGILSNGASNLGAGAVLDESTYYLRHLALVARERTERY